MTTTAMTRARERMQKRRWRARHAAERRELAALMRDKGYRYSYGMGLWVPR